jgi:predicted HNH restriction endonuclease
MNKEDQIREARSKLGDKIVEHKNFDIDWDWFKRLVYAPEQSERNKTKVALQPKDRLKYEERDKGICRICGSTFYYGSSNMYLSNTRDYKLCHLHHVIPNGGIEDYNIVTLCTHCHQMVHQAMYVAGTWKYSRPL